MSNTASVIFTKTLRDGRTATVTATGRHPDVLIDGEWWTSGAVRKLPESRPGVTHGIGGSGKILGLTAGEAREIEAGIDRVIAERDAAYAATEEGQRSRLAIAVRLAGSAYSAAGAREHPEDGWMGYQGTDKRYERACAELDAFDEAHPDLAARITAAEAQRDRELFESGMRA